ncbi:MAG: hypothetical protein ACI4LB_02540 [Candidatus Fimenecus sp.]
MEKKIIAVICVLMLLISMFAACGKKQTITADNGMEYVLVIDDEGNTVANDSGDVAVYVTDADGNYVQDDNGEKQTNYVTPPEKTVEKNKVETPDYSLTFKNNDWTVSASGIFFKNNTDESVYFKVIDLGTAAEGQTLDMVASGVVEENEKVMDEVKKIYPDAVINVFDVKITADAIDGKVVEFVVKDDNGNMVHYAHGTYFMNHGKLFKVEYACMNEQYYDPSFDILTVINDGLVIK